MAVRDALAANLRLQERLREALDSVEKGITNNADMQAKVQMASMRVNRAGWYQGLKGDARNTPHEFNASQIYCSYP